MWNDSAENLFSCFHCAFKFWISIFFSAAVRTDLLLPDSLYWSALHSCVFWDGAAVGASSRTPGGRWEEADFVLIKASLSSCPEQAEAPAGGLRPADAHQCLCWGPASNVPVRSTSLPPFFCLNMELELELLSPTHTHRFHPSSPSASRFTFSSLPLSRPLVRMASAHVLPTADIRLCVYLMLLRLCSRRDPFEITRLAHFALQ